MNFKNYNTKHNLDKLKIKDKIYLLCINFSKTQYLNLFLGHDKVDKIFKSIYDKLIPLSETHYLDKFDRLYLIFNQKNINIENLNKIINQIIKKIKNILSNYKKEITEEAKKEGFNNIKVPLIQIILGKETLFGNKENFLLFLEEKYDKLLYTINTIQRKSYYFNTVEFELNKINF